MRVCVLVGLVLLASGPAQTAEAILTGHARTIDGDTIEIGGVSIRLKGIAAPERDEPGGAEATEAMRRMIGNQEVRCELTGERTQNRAVGYCSAGGQDLNGAMVLRNACEVRLSEGGLVVRTPMRGNFSGRCERAASGESAAPITPATKCRRLTRSPRLRWRSGKREHLRSRPSQYAGSLLV